MVAIKAKEIVAPHFSSLTSPRLDSNSQSEKGTALLSAFNSEALGGVMPAVSGTLLKGYSITLTIVNLLLLPFFVYYIALSFHGLQQKTLLLLPHHARPDAQRILTQIDGSVSAYVRGQLTVCTILFFLYAVGLRIIGIDLWLLVAVIAGFGNMIPYIGTISGVIIGSVMALVTFGSVSYMLIVWALFAVVQFIEGTFITPKIIGDRVGLPPLAVILALFAGGALFGLLGIFIAVPIAAALRVLLKEGHTWLMGRYQTVPS